ncbi:hypothetical protein [Jeongeupia naejangsanensis]|uniref:Uncharacterized protein n=1 Tax=Jeongeupia naejangsanensis TaxID=613195 RepID=A0ABS2BH67_9NEIS|nr:hypothetical protein [Jeongeupia naejangsanensis]MBM3114276.1 hypothetical protein [Jeongeupia naejangsanensis]
MTPQHQLDAICAALQATLTNRTQARACVFRHRARHFQAPDMPALNVYDGVTSCEIWSDPPRVLKFDTELIVVLHIAGGELADAVAKQLLAEVEAAIHANPRLDATGQGDYQLADELVPVRYEAFADGEQGHDYQGYVTTWRATWYQDVSYPTEGTTLPSLLGVTTRYDLAPADGAIDATDIVPPQEKT